MNFVNAAEGSNVDVVFFQKNIVSFVDDVVAWKVIHTEGGGWRTPFTFSTDFQVAVQNEDGAPTPRLSAKTGEKLIVEMNEGKMTFAAAGNASNPKFLEIENHLPNQSINALVYRNGELVAREDGGGPSQIATFELDHRIWVGVCSGVEQGKRLGSKVVREINALLDLYGIVSADIVMTGGGGLIQIQTGDINLNCRMSFKPNSQKRLC